MIAVWIILGSVIACLIIIYDGKRSRKRHETFMRAYEFSEENTRTENPLRIVQDPEGKQ